MKYLIPYHEDHQINKKFYYNLSDGIVIACKVESIFEEKGEKKTIVKFIAMYQPGLLQMIINNSVY